MKVVALQHDIVWEDRAATLATLAPRVARAAAEGAHVVLLAEMFAVGFSMATERTAEAVDGPTATWLAEQAATHGVWVGGTVPERTVGADRPANVFVLAGPDGTRHRYAKRHPFTYGGEDRCYTRGDDPVTVTVAGTRCSLAVCYDLRFADQFWDQAPTTDAYLLVANWPASRQHHWRSLLVARAIENQAYVVGVNRVGRDGNGLAYAGGSCIIDPLGVLVADADDGEVALAAEVDPAVVAAVRARFPFLADRT